MNLFIRLSKSAIALLLLTVCLNAAPTSASPTHPAAAPAAQPQPANAVAEYQYTTMPEIRMRKLHLVRPDLIFYPIVQIVIC